MVNLYAVPGDPGSHRKAVASSDDGERSQGGNRRILGDLLGSTDGEGWYMQGIRADQSRLSDGFLLLDGFVLHEGGGDPWRISPMLCLLYNRPSGIGKRWPVKRRRRLRLRSVRTLTTGRLLYSSASPATHTGLHLGWAPCRTAQGYTGGFVSQVRAIIRVPVWWLSSSATIRLPSYSRPWQLLILPRVVTSGSPISTRRSDVRRS